LTQHFNELKVKYDDGESEELGLADERIRFSISSEEMKSLNLKSGISNQDKKGYDELLALAISFHDYQSLDPGDLVWAKITGIVHSCSQLLTDYLCLSDILEFEGDCLLVFFSIMSFQL
jgi:hypothetical protein